MQNIKTYNAPDLTVWTVEEYGGMGSWQGTRTDEFGNSWVTCWYPTPGQVIRDIDNQNIYSR